MNTDEKTQAQQEMKDILEDIRLTGEDTELICTEGKPDAALLGSRVRLEMDHDAQHDNVTLQDYPTYIEWAREVIAEIK